MKKALLCMILFCAVLPASAGTEMSTQELMDSGFKSCGNGEYQAAINYFEQVLSREPDNMEAKLALEKSQGELEEQKKSQTKKVETVATKDMSRAVMNEKNGDIIGMIDQIWNVLDADPKNKKANKSLEKMKSTYEDKLSNDNQGTAEWNFDEGVLAYMDKDWSRSFDFFQESRRLKPDDEATQDAGEHAQTRLLTMIHDEQTGFYRESAKALYDQGQYKDALVSWKRVAEANPNDVEAQQGITQSQEALARLETRQKSDQVIGMIEEALSLYADRKWQESLREWKKIRQVDPTVESAKEYITKINAQLASIARERAAEKAPVTDDSWRTAKKPVAAVTPTPTTLSSTEGNFPEAIKNMEAILRRDPNNLKVAQDLEKAKSRQQELAEKYYKDGLIAYSEGKVGEAIRQWQVVLRIDPEHAKARQAIVKAQAEAPAPSPS